MAVVVFSGLLPVWHGGWAPTCSGISFQPEELTGRIQEAVSCGWAQPRLLPPTYTAMAP